nr:MAG TPA: hypothetical protein [Caudoviricetes sp.]
MATCIKKAAEILTDSHRYINVLKFDAAKLIIFVETRK